MAESEVGTPARSSVMTGSLCKQECLHHLAGNLQRLEGKILGNPGHITD